jgi:hypothetical protein
MLESPVGYTPLNHVRDMLQARVPAETDVQRLIATACVQGKLSAAYRRWDGGADKLDPRVWQHPHWRSYYDDGLIKLELPLIDKLGQPHPDGRTAPNCEREIFIDVSTLEAFLADLKPAPKTVLSNDHHPSRGPKAGVQLRVADAMRADLLSGKKTPDQLRKQTEKVLEAEYSASRDTVRKARLTVLSVETLSKLSSANDK